MSRRAGPPSAAAMAVVALATVPGRGRVPGPEARLIAGATETVLLLYRALKCWWPWVIWAAGWIHREGEDPERTRPA